MAQLNYEVLRQSGFDGYLLREAPEKVMQFGEGNFLRAFVNYWFDMANERVGWNGKAVLVQPIAMGLTKLINAQEFQYDRPHYVRIAAIGAHYDVIPEKWETVEDWNGFDWASFNADGQPWDRYK